MYTFPENTSSPSYGTYGRLNIKLDRNSKNLRTEIHIDGLGRVGMGGVEEVCGVRTPLGPKAMKPNMPFVRKGSMEYK